MTINQLLTEGGHNIDAEEKTDQILELMKQKGLGEIKVGKLFGFKPSDIIVHYVLDLPDIRGKFSVSSINNSFPAFPLTISISSIKNKNILKATLMHEINHLINYLKSKGKTLDSYYKQASAIKSYKNKTDKNYFDFALDYQKNAEEINAYYNSFVILMRGYKFENLDAIRTFLYTKFRTKNMKNLIDYYLKENKAIVHYFEKKILCRWITFRKI